MSVKNSVGFYETFATSSVANLTVVSNGDGEGANGGTGGGSAGFYDVILSVLNPRYEQGATITSKLKIFNTGDLPDEDTILVYWLESPSGLRWGETTETFLEVAPGEHFFDKSITLPLNSELGGWSFNARYFTTVQPVITANDGFEVVQKLSIVDKVQNAVESSKVKFGAGAIGLGALVLIIILGVLAYILFF